MIIGTTPTFTFKFKRNSTVNMISASSVNVTFKQGFHVLTKSSPVIVDSKTVSVTLTQQESLGFTLDKKIEVQLNWTYIESGTTVRAATVVQVVDLQKQLLPQVI